MTNPKQFLLGVALTLILSACATPAAPASDQPAVRPITAILVADPQLDVQSTSATLQVTTRLPVVCAVVYGTTHDYGQIATDTDMAGGGHSDARRARLSSARLALPEAVGLDGRCGLGEPTGDGPLTVW